MVLRSESEEEEEEEKQPFKERRVGWRWVRCTTGNNARFTVAIFAASVVVVVVGLGCVDGWIVKLVLWSMDWFCLVLISFFFYFFLCSLLCSLA